MASSLLSPIGMTPTDLCQSIEGHLRERYAQLTAAGDQAPDGRRFSWCGEIFDYLMEGITERLAAIGVTCSQTFPGPFRLLDEDQESDGRHVRRFWTTALEHGCPIARLCTLFVHRHDQVMLPELPRVQAFPPDHPIPDQGEPA